MDETYQCGRGEPVTLPYRTNSIVVGEAISGSFEGAFPLLVKKGWAFDDDPFETAFSKDATRYASEVHLEMTLTHTPAP